MNEWIRDWFRTQPMYLLLEYLVNYSYYLFKTECWVTPHIYAIKALGLFPTETFFAVHCKLFKQTGFIQSQIWECVTMSEELNCKHLGHKALIHTPTLETAVISHIACWGYARKTLATMVLRTVKTSSLEWHTLEMSWEKAVRNWYGAKLAQCSPTAVLILPNSCLICLSARPAAGHGDSKCLHVCIVFLCLLSTVHKMIRVNMGSKTGRTTGGLDM